MVALAVLGLDQLTKAWVRAGIDFQSGRIELLPFLELRHVRNSGIAFGLFSGQAQLVVVGTVLVTGLLLFTLTTVPASDRLTSTSLALVAGGAFGNLLDRVRSGYVTDFIHLPNWPTFNVADCAIVLGVTGVLVMQLRDMRQERSPDTGRDWPEAAPTERGGPDADRG